jgi:uncharacterized membrane protein YcaP (DUF421 family)
MRILIEIFGEGRDLTLSQMSARGVIVFFLALLLIRLSGRRSFSMHMPLDNIISIILGAILSRAVVGASDFVPVVGVCTVIVILHRLLAWLVAHHKKMSRLLQGEKILLFEDGNFLTENLGRALVCKEDVMQGVRKSALTEDLEKIKLIYIERNGEITAIKKEV